MGAGRTREGGWDDARGAGECGSAGLSVITILRETVHLLAPTCMPGDRATGLMGPVKERLPREVPAIGRAGAQ